MLYIHVPFCKSFCIYCDFYSELQGSVEQYAEQVIAEIRSKAVEIGGHRVKTIYIGGGTPSCLPLAILRRIISAAIEVAGPVSEFTVEVNPDDITPDFASSLKSLGVTRISMGVQSLSDPMLRWMRRRHTARQAEDAFRTLRQVGFANISLDLIFGISGLTDKVLSDTLDSLLALGPEHISAYQLSIEPGSALCALAEKGLYRELPDEDCARQYALICDTLREAGYAHYEISNWAKPGFEAVHNSAYWTREPYVGVGPGAHSLSPDGLTRSWNSCKVSGWGREGSEQLTQEQVMEEKVMLGLRTARGFDGMVIPEKDWFVSDSVIADYLAKIS